MLDNQSADTQFDHLLYMSVMGTVINIVVSTITSGITAICKYVHENYDDLVEKISDLIYGKRNKVCVEYLMDDHMRYFNVVTFDVFVMKEIHARNPCKEVKLFRKDGELVSCPIIKLEYDDINYSLAIRKEQNGKKTDIYRTLVVWSRKKSLDYIKKTLDDFNKKYINVIDGNAIMIASDPSRTNSYDLFPTLFTKSLADVYDTNIRKKVEFALNTFKNASVDTRQLKIMLHGPPGTGKTTLITSIAKETNGTLIMTKISKFKTIETLRNFIFCENYDAYNAINNKFCIIKPTTKIVVFEDIDADIGKIIQKRDNIEESKKTEESSAIEKVAEALESKKTGDSTALDKKEGINLSDLLNLFDGILQMKNVIIIFTTNCIDNIDPAFYRPGRVNICEHMGTLKQAEFLKFVSDHYSEKCSKQLKGNYDGRFKISELTSAHVSTNSFAEFKKLLVI